MEPTIYLNFNGNCLEAMTHYAKTLGGEITGVFKYGDAPDPQSRIPGGEDLVMNLNLRLGAANMMACDAPQGRYGKPQGFEVSVAPKSLSEFDRIFKALSEGAEKVTMAPAETFWAERFAMFTDKYGTPWMINFAGNKQVG
jgi:PhnB protein